MLAQPAQANLNLEQARDLRASGSSYVEIRQQLGLTSNQLALIRRTLKRTKAAHTRLRSTHPGASVRDLPINQSILPAGLRQLLVAQGFRTVGVLANRLADPDFPGLETVSGIGPRRVWLVNRMLDHYDLLPGPSDLQAAIEGVFPELQDGSESVPGNV